MPCVGQTHISWLPGSGLSPARFLQAQSAYGPGRNTVLLQSTTHMLDTHIIFCEAKKNLQMKQGIIDREKCSVSTFFHTKMKYYLDQEGQGCE